MESLDASNETDHSNSSNQPGAAENSHSLYTLEHIVEEATQINQLESGAANRWVNNVDEHGYLQVLNDAQRVPLDAEVLNDDALALSEQPGDCNQQVHQAAGVDSYGYLQPLPINDAKINASPIIRLSSNDVTAADSDIINQLNLQCRPNAQNQGDTSPNLTYTAQGHEYRPRLPAPCINNPPMSDTTFVNLELPFWLKPVERSLLRLLFFSYRHMWLHNYSHLRRMSCVHNRFYSYTLFYLTGTCEMYSSMLICSLR